MNIGEKIRNHRKAAGLTQQQLSEQMNVSFQAVSSWENDEYIPDLNRLEKLAEIFGISVSKLVEDDYSEHWELHDRLFSEDNMYTFVKSAAHAKNLIQTAKVLPTARKLHEGQTRKGKDKIPYIYHPLMLACHALALGLDEDEIVATALLHDVVEDCNVTSDELEVSDDVKEAIRLLSFNVNSGETKDAAKRRYYQEIAENRIATVVKLLDRCNNISTMTPAFTKEKTVEYIDETENYVMPLLDCMKYNYPEYNDAAFLLKYHMRSVLESLKHIL